MLSQKLALAAAGNAAAAIYVDDVFSTFVYDGNGSTQSINNGIDLSGEGGMVWLKRRNTSNDHYIGDTARGAGKVLLSNENIAQLNWNANDTFKSFDSSGFTVGGNSGFNGSSDEMCSWTFRKCLGFFDVVTYTGNGSHRDISHSLGSEPGSIWIKRTDSAESWIVYHRSLDSGGGSGATAHFAKLELESTGSEYGGTLLWSSSGGGEDHTASTFHVSNHSSVNANGGSFVAYIFAHNDQSFGDNGDEAVIKCGNYTGNGGTQSINVGFEPQFLITKRIDSSGNWFIHDVMRKFSATGTNEAATLRANSNLGEYTNTARIHVNSTGFDFDAEGSSDVNASSGSYVYIAIRRPHKPPEAGTECFDVFTQAGSSSTQLRPGTSGSGVTDMAIIKNVDNNYDWVLGARLLGQKNLIPNSTASESTSKFGTTDNVWDQMSGTELQSGVAGTNLNSSNNYVNYHFTRKPGFFDVVSYTGTGSAQTVNHNLGVAPELMIVKQRDGGSFWAVYSSALGATKYLSLASTNAANSSVAVWNNTSPTSSVFTVNYAGSVNNSGSPYIAYLFASLDGISKVGRYTGTGSDLNIDCGFTNGARFVLIKRDSGTTDWWVLDTARGINAGTDPAHYLNGDAAETSAYDLVDPYSAGFTAVADTAAINSSGETYIFLAIA